LSYKLHFIEKAHVFLFVIKETWAFIIYSTAKGTSASKPISSSVK